MHRKVAAVWVSLIILISSIVILVEIAEIVEAPTTHYVGGAGGGNYSKIQWAIDNASDGNTVFVYNGTYYENVIVNKTINLTGEDRDNTTIYGSGSDNVVIVTASWINITEFTISNSKSMGYGLVLDHVDYCKVVKNNLINNDGGLNLVNSSRNLIDSNNITNLQMGMELNSGSNLNFIGNNTIMDSANGIFLNTGSNRNTMFNNTILNGGGVFIILSTYNTLFNNEVLSNDITGVYLQNSPYNIIEFNKISNNKNHGIQASFSTNIIIRGNTIDNNTWDGIEVSSPPSNNCTIENNTISFNKENGLDWWFESVDCVIQNNNIMNNINQGIELRGAVNCKISENNMTGNIRALNLHDSPSFNNTISRNRIYENSDGIRFVDTSNNNISSNEIFLNTGGGLVLSSSEDSITYNQIYSNKDGILNFGTSNNTYSNNLIYNNSFHSFFCSGSINSTAFENTIWNNDHGVHLVDSSNNTFHHNNIVNNSIQAWLTDSSDNIWDDGAGEGNFWSDYTGVDNGSGGRPKGDGVGDTQIPHPFIDQGDGYFQLDNYPLINSIGEYIFLIPGWNLISIPKIQANENVGFVLSPITNYYDAVQWYNNTDLSDHWKHYHILKDSKLNDLDNINHKIGFWIHITDATGVLFEYNGTTPTSNQTIHLHPGWNIVGYPSLTNRNRTTGLNNLTFDTHVDAIQWYDAATKTWHFMGPDDYFVPCRGYWIHAVTDCEWIVPL